MALFNVFTCLLHWATLGNFVTASLNSLLLNICHVSEFNICLCHFRCCEFSGEKPYVCTSEGCGKRFTEYSSLYKHHVVHTQKKPYECIDCGKTYRQTSTLAMHRRTAHADVSSDPAASVSSAFFLTAGDFLRHRNIIQNVSLCSTVDCCQSHNCITYL